MRRAAMPQRIQAEARKRRLRAESGGQALNEATNENGAAEAAPFSFQYL